MPKRRGRAGNGPVPAAYDFEEEIEEEEILDKQQAKANALNVREFDKFVSKPEDAVTTFHTYTRSLRAMLRSVHHYSVQRQCESKLHRGRIF